MIRANVLQYASGLWRTATSQSIRRNISIDSGKSKIYEFRQYWMKPSGASSFMKLFEEFYPVRVKHSELFGYWTVDLGGINQVVHIWEYDSFEQRANVRAALAQDKHWVEGFVKKAFPHLDRQENSVMYSAEWCNLLKDKASDGAYELATYGMKTGGPSVWENQLKGSLLAHTKHDCDLVGVWYTDVGDHNQVRAIWRYDNFDVRRQARNSAHADSVLVNKMRDNLKNVETHYNVLMNPLPFVGK